MVVIRSVFFFDSLAKPEGHLFVVWFYVYELDRQFVATTTATATIHFGIVPPFSTVAPDF